jgi:hypothetical protein
MWHCKDPNHSPFLLTKHYLKLILLQMCTLWKKQLSFLWTSADLGWIL